MFERPRGLFRFGVHRSAAYFLQSNWCARLGANLQVQISLNPEDICVSAYIRTNVEVSKVDAFSRFNTSLSSHGDAARLST